MSMPMFPALAQFVAATAGRNMTKAAYVAVTVGVLSMVLLTVDPAYETAHRWVDVLLWACLIYFVFEWLVRLRHMAHTQRLSLYVSSSAGIVDAVGALAVPVALLGPKRSQHDPQDRRPGVGDGDPEIGDSDLAPDRRHYGLKRGVSGRSHEHRRVEQEEMRPRQRGRSDPVAGGSVQHGFALDRELAGRKPPKRVNLEKQPILCDFHAAR